VRLQELDIRRLFLDTAKGLLETYCFFPTAKWNKIEILHVPMEFFQEFLSDMGKPEPNSVKDMHHWRPPMMQASVLRVSYKIYDKPSFERVLGVSGLNLKWNEKWSGQEVISSTPVVDEITTAQDAIRVAMPRRQQKKVTTSSQITIHEGKKPSRELEVIWWPNMYPNTKNYGKLCLRFYVGKVVFE